MSESSVDLVVSDARVVAERGTIRGGVACDDGRIVAIGSDACLPPADRVIDADGNFLLPGFVDPHVHLGRRDAGYPEQLEIDFETETRGAVHGGVTTLLNFVEQGDQYLPDWDDFVDVGERNSYVDFGHHAVMSHEHHIEEIPGLVDRGVTSFKMFFNMYKYHDIDIEPCEADRVHRVLSHVAEYPEAVGMFHCENAEIQREMERELRESGREDLQAWRESSPPVAEAMQIEHVGRLTRFSDANSYAVHVSSAEGADVVERYRREGVNLHGETLVTFLVNTADEDLGVWGKVSPPLRDERHQERLWEALRQGVIRHVGTDHIATSKEVREGGEGKYGNMWAAPPGIQPGVEFFLPMMVSEGYNRNRLSMERIVEVCATNNAKRFGLYPRKGVIAEGADADLVVVDPQATTVIDDDFFHTREPRWSSVHGRGVQGLPTHTIAGGEVVVECGDLHADPGRGSYLHRGPGGETA
ncbi:amidohydrolase family protein [Halorubellus sp. JP-L1]|uniref:dihydroorotase n=1 Tax=Halorubellus sp. JP-L1 TaxID=2715753 RepID=UPI001407F6A0|nr:amidohydrolase family protein [Halorubellus sp. JP-L1]NHN42836.1 amidohydrolase family protein [Halorubellus sp. JP-L1]